MSNRMLRNVTELKGITAECLCGGTMIVWNYGSLYWGVCASCGMVSKKYHKAFAVKNEQHKLVVGRGKENV
jgi:hypothetical protein